MRTICKAITLLTAACISFSSNAALGPYVHGYGIKSLGFGGIGIGEGDDTTVLVANPAHAYSIGERYDIGLDVHMPSVKGSIVGNSAGPDQDIESRSGARALLAIPQGGYSTRLSDRLGLGMTLSVAGLGPQYPDNNPYRRFGGGDNANLKMSQSGLLTALGYALTPDQVVGLSVNLVYQTLKVNGVSPFAAYSQTPSHVSNQGTDGRPGIGYAVGWKGQLTSWASVGAVYTSKTYTERQKGYEGLIPGGGKLGLPARYGAGIVITPHPQVTLAVDFQRTLYHSEKALGNSVNQLSQGYLLGSENGPGFGLHDQNAYKFGAAWRPTSNLELRAGYIYATQMTQRGETLFSFLAPTETCRHYTAGATYSWTQWELSGYSAYAPRTWVYGQNSIPAALGGGEANVSNQFISFGLSLGRRFGK
jgi:long-chain fatty acid transport protein